MMLQPIKPRVLAARVIANVADGLRERLELAPGQRAIGLLTCTSDDALYAALDEGTKAANVEVVFAKSFYAGSAHASGPLSGEILGIFAAADPDEITSAMAATLRYLETKAWFYAADHKGKLAFFPHVIPSVGRYLARQAGVEPGTSMAYLIAPPIEAVIGLDEALKAAQVEMKVYYAPPSETNFAGGLLVGEQTECEAAAAAFQRTVLDLAEHPHRLSPNPSLQALSERFAHHRADTGDSAKYRLQDSGMVLDHKPEDYTHLFDDRSLVRKDHPIIRLRGKLDLLQAYILDAILTARQEGLMTVAQDLTEILDFTRKLMATEVVGRPCPELHMGGLDAEDLHKLSYQTTRYLKVGFLLPDASMGPTVVKLNLLRAFSREVELTAVQVFDTETHVPADTAQQIQLGLNRVSNAVYVVACKIMAQRQSQSPSEKDA